ncbi:MAG: DNA-protecting protein DprA, partial [Defluviitaleaceae bacterium]|nr:DNA-protecting protein DprA [Defluviitaleaceae bacterium]
VDSMAHRGALSGGGKTIAVLGCGADICYPAENRELREEIIKNGCIISEYPPGTTPQAFFFPARNRIISGLSCGIVVAEAGKKSGTLITVDQAMEQGREVFAVPGNISSKLSEGTNQLIRDGAFPVSDFEDILYALGISPAPDAPPEPVKKSLLAPEEKRVYDSLDLNPVSFDMLAEITEIQPGRLHFICTGLEIKGLIRKLPGSRYVRS